MPRQRISVLAIEDNPDDLLLTLEALRQGGIEPDFRHVTDDVQLEAALREREWDVAISDHNLPGFDSRRALQLVQRHQPELPFIIVSGVFGDQAAIDAISSGASDVVRKDMLARLVPVLRRELRGRDKRHELLASCNSLEQMAFFDPLTGLPNNQGFLRQLRGLLEQPFTASFGVVLLQLQRFQQLKRYLGLHACANLILQMAQRIQLERGRAQFLSRIAEDRFALILPQVSGEDAMRAWLSDFLAQLPSSTASHGAIQLSWHAGASLCSESESCETALMHRAEFALSRANHERRSHFVAGPCDKELDSDYGYLDGALRQALRRDEFSLHYQPQYDLRYGRCVGAEALLRWKHPKRGYISPAEFIPVLEDTGLIVPVGEWVLRKACQQVAAWRREGWEAARVSVNVAMLQFEQPSLAETVRSILREEKVPATALELEITESIAMTDRDQVLHALSELRGLGVGLAIDDFGTGYCSLAYLKYFPVDRLKIDQTFVKGIDRDPRDGAIVCAAISMARSFGLEVIAEGVETAAHVTFLREQGCNHGQGFHLGRPVHPELFDAWRSMPSKGGAHEFAPAGCAIAGAAGDGAGQ